MTRRIVAERAHQDALRRAADLPDELLDGLGCPLVMAEPLGWASSRHGLLLAGQETASWSIPDAPNLRACLALPRPVESLASAYATFDFGCAAPRVHFIRAMRRLERELENGTRGAVMWTNVAHVDCAPTGRASASIAALPHAQRESVLAWQRGLLAAEIADLRPNAFLATSGPKYDDALRAEFEGLRFEPIGKTPVRDLARLVHPSLPAASFRTHHPRTLEIAKAPHLATVIDLVRKEVAERPRNAGPRVSYGGACH